MKNVFDRAEAEIAELEALKENATAETSEISTKIHEEDNQEESQSETPTHAGPPPIPKRGFEKEVQNRKNNRK